MPDELISGDPKAQWLERVLGFTLPRNPPSGGSQTKPNWVAARQRWQAAIEAVDGQIAALQTALRKTDDDELEAIAQFGMNGLTGDHKVKLMVAMMDVGGGDRAAMRSAGPNVRAIAQEFRKHIESDERVGACDDNPFGVAVAIRATLAPALATLIASVEVGMR